MKKLPWAVVALVGVSVAANVAFVGCGSESSTDIPSDDGGTDGSSDDGSNNQDDGGASDGSFIDVIADGAGRSPDASVACTPATGACTKSTDCCTANCDPTSGKCIAPATVCGLPGDTCTVGTQCCTGSCVSGKCSNLQCVADNGACGVSSDCCSETCAPDGKGGGVCQPLGTKPTSGNPCTTNTQCASGWCNNGICANPSFCTVDGDICATDQQCCGGFCKKASGATVGVCAVATGSGSIVGGDCKPAGELCDPNGTCTGATCCSRSCAPSPISGLSVCQPESGCHMIGDLCTSTSECCGVKDLPGSIKNNGGGASTNVQCQIAAGQTVGRCNYVTTVCSPAGALCKPGNQTSGGAMACSTKIDCCAGNANQVPTCQIDLNGIPRCTVTGNLDCSGGPKPAGTQCATSADCCGSPCLPNTDPATQPTKPYVCGATACQTQGNVCTSNGDCCSGLPCAIAPGGVTGICGGTVLTDGGVSTQPPPGTDGGVIVTTQDAGAGSDAGVQVVCALYGQTCTQSSDCCSGVPCTGGTCHYP